MRDRNDPPECYHVDFYNAGATDFSPEAADHNDIIRSFSELCFLSQGRTFIIREPATLSEYMDNLQVQAA